MKKIDLEKIAKLLRYYIIQSTTKAGSGHPTSSLSAVELMAGLMFGGQFRFDVKKPKNPNNDRLIFSKGHASPLFYSLWLAAGAVTPKQMMTYRKFGSPLEGHPVMSFPYTEAATGSLGQGLSIGVGMAINAKYLDKLSYKTYVLLGDSEMAEGSAWEAIQLSVHYKLDNLVAILDVNRLGQSTATMSGHNVLAYQKKFSAFGWQTIVIDGHDFAAVTHAYQQASQAKGRPVVIIAKTIKGKGVSFLENKLGWHGKALKPDEAKKALIELGQVDLKIRGQVLPPRAGKAKSLKVKFFKPVVYKLGDKVATRKAYGYSLARLVKRFPQIVALDGEVSNSTYAEDFAAVYPERYFEMFIAEQNMVGTAVGLANRGKIPFVSTFAAFFSRAFDQIRMSRYSNANIKFVGSHAGVSIGEDGPSQMGLEEIAMFRTLLDSVVLYPSDAVSADKLFEQAARHQGIVYIQTTRAATPVIYKNSESFPIGGSKVLRQSNKDEVTVISAGITLSEALKAAAELGKEKINTRVIDLYSVKPIDVATIKKAAKETKAIIVVEDGYHEGGLGEAVLYCLAELAKVRVPVRVLAVRKMPKSGQPEQLLNYEGISAAAIIREIKKLIKK